MAPHGVYTGVCLVPSANAKCSDKSRMDDIRSSERDYQPLGELVEFHRFGGHLQAIHAFTSSSHRRESFGTKLLHLHVAAFGRRVAKIALERLHHLQVAIRTMRNEAPEFGSPTGELLYLLAATVPSRES